MDAAVDHCSEFAVTDRKGIFHPGVIDFLGGDGFGVPKSVAMCRGVVSGACDAVFVELRESGMSLGTSSGFQKLTTLLGSPAVQPPSERPVPVPPV